MSLVDRVSETRLATRPDSRRFTADQYISDYLIPAGQFNYNGQNYPLGLNTTAGGWARTKEISQSLPAYASALRRCPPAFAAQMVRALVLSQARFTFRTRIFNSTPRKLFGTAALSILDHPWPNGTTGELISRMEWHAGCAGNSFVTDWDPGRLRVLRPDWVAIAYGSDLEPEDPGFALDGEVIGYVYQNGGFGGANKNPIRTLRVAEVAHWCPLPDPLSPGLGMSWITPALRDMQGDGAATEHKLRFFENGATPNLIIKGLPAVTEEKFNALVDMLEANHTGIRNAYRTMYLTAGADATIVGADMKQMDFANVQGKGETRIAMLSRVPAAVLQISEGLAGSSLNAGNFIASRRVMADTWVFPTLQDLAGSLAPLVDVPPDAELWPDVADMPFLREDAKDAADIELVKGQNIGGLVKDGFTPESAIAAVMGQNMTLLKPIPGWISVQLQTMAQAKNPPPPPAAPSAPSNGSTPPNGHANGQAADAKAVARSQEMVTDELRFQNRELSETLRAMMDMPQPQAPTINAYITVPERSVLVENNIQPANALVEIQGDTIHVEPAAITVPVTVNTPEMTVQGDTITVQPAAVSIPVTVQPANAPEVTIQGDTINIEPAQVTVEPADVINNVTVQPAEANVTVQGDTITVEPAAVSIPVTVQPAKAPDVTIQGDTINVQPPDVQVPVTVTMPEVQIQPANVTVEAPITVNIPPEPPDAPSKGVTVQRDSKGNVTGVTPKK